MLGFEVAAMCRYPIILSECLGSTCTVLDSVVLQLHPTRLVSMTPCDDDLSLWARQHTQPPPPSRGYRLGHLEGGLASI